MSARKVLLVGAVLLFLAAGVGFATLSLGTVTLSLVGFGLACLAASFLFA